MINVSIRYYNTRGLNNQKFNLIEQQLIHGNQTIMILAETWFPVWPLYYTQSPYYITQSIPEGRTPGSSRPKGGLALLASPELRSAITVVRTAIDSIKFKIGSLTVLAMYVKPSLPDQQVSTMLRDADPRVDLLLGDINVQYNESTGLPKIPRGNVFQQIVGPLGLRRILPSAGTSTNDHLFANRHVEWTYWDPGLLSSDHLMMDCTVDVACSVEPVRPVYRYNLKSLELDQVALLVSDDWGKTYGRSTMHLLLQANRMLSASSEAALDDGQDMIDSLYGVFQRSIHSIRDKYFPRYPVQAVRRHHDSTLDQTTRTTTLQTLRAVKRIQRSSADRSKIVSPDPNVPAMDYALQKYSSLFAAPHSGRPVEVDFDLGDEPVNTPFTPTSTRQCLMSYSSAKSEGPDLIHTRLLKALARDDRFVAVLSMLFTVLFKFGRTPRAWNHSSMVLLPKVRTTDCSVDQTRPISMTMVLRRLFERMLLQRWGKTPWAQVSVAQSGFQKDMSTLTSILAAHELMIRDHRRVAFLDIKAAYDTVPFDRLLLALKSRGAPPRDIALVHSLMCCHLTSDIVVNQERSSLAFDKARGLMQGSVLSPMLFNVFIDSLCLWIQQDTDTVPLLFADDIALLARNDADLQQALDVCGEWAESNGLQFNIAKSKTINTESPLMLAGDRLDVVQHYTYLGVVFSGEGIDAETSLRSQIDKHRRFRNWLNVSCCHWHPDAKLTAIKTFLNPLLDYGLPLMDIMVSKRRRWDNLRKELHLAYDSGLSLIVGNSRKSPDLYAKLSQTLPCEWRAQQLAGSLTIQIRRLPDDHPISGVSQQTLRVHAMSILQPLMTLPIITAYNHHRHSSSTTDTRQPLPWMQFLWVEYNKAVEKKRLKTVDYFTPAANIDDKSGKCPAFRFDDTKTAERAIRWCKGELFLNAKCPNGASFTRRQTATVLDGDQTYDRIMNDSAYLDRAESIRAKFARRKGGQRLSESLFTPLDHAINTGDEAAFKALTDALYARLYPAQTGPPAHHDSND
jgi:hypothetical protein